MARVCFSFVAWDMRIGEEVATDVQRRLRGIWQSLDIFIDDVITPDT